MSSLLAGEEPPEFDPRVLRRHAQFVTGAAVFLCCLGVAVLAGWLWRIPLLTSVLPGAVAMKPNTAVCVMSLGIALYCSRPGRSPWHRRAGAGGALLVVVVTTVTLVEYAARVDLGVDLFLMDLLVAGDPAVAASPHPGRMAPNTAAGLLLLGAAHLVRYGPPGRRPIVSQLLSLGGGTIGMLGLYGYAYHAPELESPLDVTGMALHTALGVTVASAAIFLAPPAAGMARMLTSREKSSMMLRRMLSTALLVPPLLGWLRLAGEDRGLYSPSLGVALLVAANAAVFVALTCATGARVMRLEEEHRRVEAELAWRSAAAAMAEAAPDAMVGVDPDGVIVLANGQAERMFGYRRDEMLGRPVEMLLPQPADAAHPAHRAGYLRDLGRRRTGPDADLRARRKNGAEIPVEINVAALDTDDQQLVVAAVHDVTERLRFEHQLREKNLQLEQANHAKDAFLATMSHELRTPLNAIIGFTGILLMGLPGPLNEEQTHQLQLVESSGQHLLSLINDVLDLAKLEAGKMAVTPEHLDCAAAAREITAAMYPQARRKGVALVIDIPLEPCVVLVDRRALRQILTNLLDNAIKFTTEGEVRVSLTRAHPGAEWALKVSDTGPGIDPREHARIFEAFHRTTDAHRRGDDGAGLGLYISHTLAELMGCRMRLDSDIGRGSTFTLTLAT